MLCLAVTLVLLPLSPASTANPGALIDTAYAPQAEAAVPCHDAADPACGGAESHCAACHVLVLAPLRLALARQNHPAPALRLTADNRSLPQPGVPPGPPRLA